MSRFRFKFQRSIGSRQIPKINIRLTHASLGRTVQSLCRTGQSQLSRWTLLWRCPCRRAFGDAVTQVRFLVLRVWSQQLAGVRLRLRCRWVGKCTVALRTAVLAVLAQVAGHQFLLSGMQRLRVGTVPVQATSAQLVLQHLLCPMSATVCLHHCCHSSDTTSVRSWIGWSWLRPVRPVRPGKRCLQSGWIAGGQSAIGIRNFWDRCAQVPQLWSLWRSAVRTVSEMYAGGGVRAIVRSVADPDQESGTGWR